MVFAVKFVEISILTVVKVLRVIMLILHRLRFHQGKGVDADVGTLVGNTFDIHQNIQEGNAAVNRSVAAVESVDVIRTELGNEVVDDLFNRLYFFCGNNIKFCKSLIRIIQHLCDCFSQHCQLLMSNR